MTAQNKTQRPINTQSLQLATIFILCILAWFYCKQVEKNLDLYHSGKVTVGTVLSVETRGTGDKTRHHLTIEYDNNKATIPSINKLKVGARVGIYYSMKDTNNVVFLRKEHPFKTVASTFVETMALIILAVSGLITALTAFGLRISKKHNAVLAAKQALEQENGNTQAP